MMTLTISYIIIRIILLLSSFPLHPHLLIYHSHILDMNTSQTPLISPPTTETSSPLTFPEKLRKLYPRMFPGGDYSVPSTWEPLVLKLCDVLSYYQGVLDDAYRSDQYTIKCVQMKEKFGALRFYLESEDPVIEKIVAYYSHLSTTICQQCGTSRDVSLCFPNQWYTYLCPLHAPSNETN